MEIFKRIDNAIGYIELKHVRMVENILFEPPESVGTIRLHWVYKDTDSVVQKDKAMMDMGYEAWGEKSPYVSHLPAGIFKNQQIVEVIVRKRRTGISNGVLVAIRPFVKETYGRFFGPGDYINDIFSFNLKTPDTSPKFFQKFLKV